MHYIFLDETYDKAAPSRIFITSAWLVEQATLNRAWQRIPRGNPRSVELNAYLETVKAIGLVTRVDLPKPIMRPGEIDQCDDIPAMARTNNAWAVAMVFTLGVLLKYSILNRQDVGTVDGYFDPRDLGKDFQPVFDATIRNLLPVTLQRLVEDPRLKLAGTLKIRRIEFVKKPRTGEQPDKFQRGVRMADRMCAVAPEIMGQGLSCIKFRDLSTEVASTLAQYDGVPYEKSKLELSRDRSKGLSKDRM
jgi:hypothetical protein